MSRHRLTEADAQRLQSRTSQHGIVTPVTKPRRPLLRLGVNRPAWSSAVQTSTGWNMTWIGYLPRVSNKQVHHKAVWALMRRARAVFGELPPFMHPQQRARVQVLRVLGPGQKGLDRDKISTMCAGLIDALVPSYIQDDSERWADITYTNQDGRRDEGPYIMIIITYEGHHP